jgi:N-acetylglucosamine malate deacetylase 1
MKEIIQTVVSDEIKFREPVDGWQKNRRADGMSRTGNEREAMMKQPYRPFIDFLTAAEDDAKTVETTDMEWPEHPPPPPEAPVVAMLSPHPDDECIVGGLALRLARQSALRVVNVAVTLGTQPERKAARWEELNRACRYAGFEVVRLREEGYDDITLEGRRDRPDNWKAARDGIADLLGTLRPAVVMAPHAEDWHPTHVGTRELAEDALRALGGEGDCLFVETEFWRPMREPNLMCEVSPADLADLMAALSLHEGEVARNPYHMRLPAWMQDNVRRGGEVVGNQGGRPPAFHFATLYRVTRWTGSEFALPWERGRFLGAKENPVARLGSPHA